MNYTNFFAGAAVLTSMIIQPVTRSFARDRAGNGGDDVVLRFTNAGYDVYSYMNRHPKLLPEVNPARFLDALVHAQISSTDQSLFLGSVEKDAINYPNKQEININRSRWNSIPDEKTRWSLVAHEVFGLMGLDDNSYRFSSALISQLNVLSSGSTAGIFNFDVAQALYNSLTSQIPKDLSGSWILKGWTHTVAQPEGVYDPDGLTLAYPAAIATMEITPKGSTFLSPGNVFQIDQSVKGGDSSKIQTWLFDELVSTRYQGTHLIAQSQSNVLTFTATWAEPVQFTYECRMISSSRLLCAKRMEVTVLGKDHAGFYGNQKNLKKYDHTIVSFEGYELKDHSQK
jgi:hypothetical protein